MAETIIFLSAYGVIFVLLFFLFDIIVFNKTNDNDSANSEINKTTLRWRISGGIQIPLIVILTFSIYGPRKTGQTEPSIIEIYPWIHYPYLILFFINIIIIILIFRNERKK
jgi:hypothetical protein